MNTEIKFYIPFEGFYHSIYDSLIDSLIECEIEDNYLTQDEADNINYNNIFNQLSEHIFDEIIELFVDELDMPIFTEAIIYEGLSSPKYYNYSTDKIIAVCTNEVYLAIYNKTINNKDFINYANEASKSRSGFHSFYEGIEEIKKEPAIYLEYLFQWFNLNEYRDEVINKTCDNIHEVIYNNLTINQ